MSQTWRVICNKVFRLRVSGVNCRRDVSRKGHSWTLKQRRPLASGKQVCCAEQTVTLTLLHHLPHPQGCPVLTGKNQILGHYLFINSKKLSDYFCNSMYSAVHHWLSEFLY